MRLSLAVVFLCLCLPADAGFRHKSGGTDADYVKTMPDDPRRVRSGRSDEPQWLEAVGRMLVPDYAADGEINGLQSCTMTLVADRPGKQSKIGLTAAHCLKTWQRRGVDGVDQWTTGAMAIPDEDVVAFWSSSAKAQCARREDSDPLCGATFRRVIAVHGGQRTPGDYAIVELNEPLHDIQPLIASPWDLSYMRKFFTSRGEYYDPEVYRDFTMSAAGYSSDVPLGDRGRRLTFHVGCYFNGGPAGQKDSSCYSYGGASGGPMVASITLPSYVGPLPEECFDEEWEEGDPRIPLGYDWMFCDHAGQVERDDPFVLDGEIHLVLGVIKGGMGNAPPETYCSRDDSTDCYTEEASTTQHNDDTFWTPIHFFMDKLLPVLERN